MKKKLCVCIISLLSLVGAYTTFISGELMATGSGYNAGGNVTGRIGDMKKGDRVNLYTNGYSMQLIANNINGTGNKTWYSMSTKIDDTVDVIYDETGATDKNGNVCAWRNKVDLNDFDNLGNSYECSNLRAKSDAANKSLVTRDLEMIMDKIIFTYDLSTVAPSDDSNCSFLNCPRYIQPYKGEINKLFVPIYFEFGGNNVLSALTSSDTKFSKNYLLSNVFKSISNKWSEATSIKGADPSTMEGVDIASGGNIRYSAYLQLEDVVFSTSKGTSTGFAKINEPIINSDLYLSVGENMKMRFQDSSLTSTLIQIQNKHNSEITKTSKNSIIYLNAEANANSTVFGINTVSVLVFDQSDKFLYYLPLETAKGDGLYEFDTTGLELGKYKIAIVNEVYNEASTAPADCSAMSDVKELEIVTPISNLSFTPKNNLKYSSNVNVGDTVGTISSSNGADTPVYTLVADLDHASDVTKFELGTDGKTVQVKDNALDAGTYSFKIQAQDANGYPATPLEINATVTVSKDAATIAFNDSTQTKKSMSDAQTSWNETATNTPSNNELKVTYSKKSGDIGIITIDPDTGAVQASSANAKGKVTIQATVDDNPTTGKDNYEATSTTKEIMIYQGVNGAVTPDSASSDPNNPTFGAMDENIKIGGKIGVITGSEGTPDNGVSGTTTYTYGLKSDGDSSYFSVNPTTGAITSKVNLSVENYTITVTVSDKWSTKEIPVTISVGQASAEALKFYDANNKNTIITSQSASLNSSGVIVFAEVKGSSNTNAVKYGIKSGASTSVVDVHQTSGAITIKSVGTTTITATKQGEVGQAEAYAELSFTITAGTQNFIYTDNASNELPKNADGSYQSYQEAGKEVVYEKGKNFQLYTSGAPAGSSVTYALKSGSPTDVIRVDADGKVHILNATLPIQTDKIIVEATSSDPNGNYADKTIEIAINIAKAEVTVSFNGVTNVVSGTGSVDPLINDQDISSNEGGVSVADTQYIISVDASIPNDIAWTNDGISINYEYSEETGIDIPLKLTKPANRNYNKAEANGSLHILSPTENILEVSTPGKITYGDTFTIRSLQDDSSSTNVSYTFTSKDSSYIKENTQTGNQMKFDAIKASGNSEIEVDVERSADGELPLKKTIKVKVLPKDVNVQVNDKIRFFGEANPVFTYEDFTTQLVTWNGVRDAISESDIKLSTTAISGSQKGTYPIISNSSELNAKYMNYTFKFTDAKLEVKQDDISSAFYNLLLDDGKQTPYTGTWTNQDVLFISKHSSYIHVSDDNATWLTPQIKIETEGSEPYNFWMKNDTGAITSPIQTTIKIDKQAPSIKKIEAKSSGNILEDILNKLSFGYFFKPGTMFTVYTEDSNGVKEVSKTKELAYIIQKKQADGSFKDIDTANKITQVVDEKASIKIGESSGLYKICATATDYAGNKGNEECREVKLAYPGVNESSDDDELPDLNIDLNDDGIPDINITKNPGEKKPWTNIDTGGVTPGSSPDGIPDMNIDKDKDGIPDLNTGLITEWICDKKVDIDNDGKPDYKTSSTPKGFNNLDTDKDTYPDVNIDQDLNGLPELNINTDGKFDKPNIEIDGNGDRKADINLDSDKDGKPDKNIVEITSWKPDYNVEVDGKIKYDTMLIENPGGKDELEDNDIVVQDPNGSFLPNYALKVDVVTTTIEQNVKDKIIEKANGQVIKEVYDVKLMKDGIKVQPDGRLKIKIPLPKNIINPQLVIELADGTYRKISAEVIDNYLVYESDYLGNVIVVGDSDIVSLPNEDKQPNTGGSTPPSVKGAYTSTGGANTGDTTNILLYVFMGGLAFYLLMLAVIRKKRRYRK